MYILVCMHAYTDEHSMCVAQQVVHPRMMSRNAPADASYTCRGPGGEGDWGGGTWGVGGRWGATGAFVGEGGRPSLRCARPTREGAGCRPECTEAGNVAASTQTAWRPLLAAGGRRVRKKTHSTGLI